MDTKVVKTVLIVVGLIGLGAFVMLVLVWWFLTAMIDGWL